LWTFSSGDSLNVDGLIIRAAVSSLRRSRPLEVYLFFAWECGR
jgi:hypothetical protein